MLRKTRKNLISFLQSCMSLGDFVFFWIVVFFFGTYVVWFGYLSWLVFVLGFGFFLVFFWCVLVIVV